MKLHKNPVFRADATLSRRQAASVALPLALPLVLPGAFLGLGACSPEPSKADRLAAVPGGFVGAAVERGHLLRAPLHAASPTSPIRRTDVLVIGGGIAGLAAALELQRQGIDCALLELEDRVGGNSRSHSMRGLDCPAGAHYLPVPDGRAPEVQRLLVELGLAEHGAAGFALTPQGQRHLCHSPQERVWYQGAWHEGLLPLDAASAQTREQTREQMKRFAQQVEVLRRAGGFVLPLLQTSLSGGLISPGLKRNQSPPTDLSVLDAINFDAWLSSNGFTDPMLRQHLDYCCRDDYGAGLAEVSAWGGLHYFASRHGFGPAEEGAGLLTWPQGNGWLADRMAERLGERIQPARLVRHVTESRAGVEAMIQRFGKESSLELWQAKRCIVATPLRVAAKIVQPASTALQALAAQTAYSAWVVVNAAISVPLHEPQGSVSAAWDNIVFGSNALGYVDAGHQALSAAPARSGPTVLTHYRALGTSRQAALDLLQKPWAHWRDAMLADLAEPHPDLSHRLTQIHVMRYGHAMAVPKTGMHKSVSAGLLAALANQGISPRIAYAHSDLAGYSVFEEAFTAGTLVARRMAKRTAA